MVNYKIIGLHISENRKKKGFTQEKLSESLDITPQYLSLIENGHRPTNLELLVKISDILGISIDCLLFGNQSGDLKAYGEAFSELISDCNDYERNVILNAAKSLKDILDKYEELK